MSTALSVIILLAVNLGLVWLLIAAPIGRRTITLHRIFRSDAATIWHAVDPRGAAANWHPSILSSRAVETDETRVLQSLRQQDRVGQPVQRTLAIESSSGSLDQTFAYQARIVEDSALDVSFWQDFHEHRSVRPLAEGSAALTVALTDRYRGVAFLIYRYFSLRRELAALDSWLSTGTSKSGGLFEHPLMQALLAIVSTLMLWPFFGLSGNGLVISSLLTFVIVLHELGHMTAYRAFGHTHVRMIFVPLLGGIALGSRPYATLFEVATCALMGAGMSAFLVPVIIAAHDSAIYGLLPNQLGPPLMVLLLILAAFNLLNLLPMHRFDGGQVLRQIFPDRSALLLGSFLVTAMILWIGWRIGVPTMALLAALSVFTLMSLIRSSSVKPRHSLTPMTTGERMMAGFGLYAAVSIHGYAVIFACDHLFH